MKKPEPTSGPAAMLARRGEYTVAEAARLIDRSPDTVRRWIRSGKVHPRRVACGATEVSVFNKAEIQDLRRFSTTVKIGRPPAGLTPMKKRSR